MYTIKHAAQQVGITAATLRAWERRYAVISPRRTDGGYRIYDDRDVDVLRAMKDLIAQGWQPGLAADEAVRRSTFPPTVQPVHTVERLSSPPGLEPQPLGVELVAAAAALDATGLTAVLDQLFALNSFEVVVSQYLFPALEELGDAWADGRVSVAGEHLASSAVMRRLSMAYEAAAAHANGPRVALGLAPSCRHEIGLLAFAVALRRRGLSTEYVGADLPLDDWMKLAEQRDLAAVVLAIPTEADVPATSDVIDTIRRNRPSLMVAVGGAEQTQAPQGTLILGHEVSSGADNLVGAIAAPAR